MDRTASFWEWAEAELDRRGLNWYRVETIAGVSNNSVSGRARELLPPTPHTLDAIATAFNLPRDMVYRRAGRLPSQPEIDEQLQEVLHIFQQLSPDEQRTVLIQIRALAARYTTHLPVIELEKKPNTS